MSTKLRLATRIEAGIYLRDAQNWYAGPSRIMFGSSSSVARLAVAEYIANCNGHTLYESVIHEQNKADTEGN